MRVWTRKKKDEEKPKPMLSFSDQSLILVDPITGVYIAHLYHLRFERVIPAFNTKNILIEQGYPAEFAEWGEYGEFLGFTEDITFDSGD